MYLLAPTLVPHAAPTPLGGLVNFGKVVVGLGVDSSCTSGCTRAWTGRLGRDKPGGLAEGTTIICRVSTGVPTGVLPSPRESGLSG